MRKYGSFKRLVTFVTGLVVLFSISVPFWGFAIEIFPAFLWLMVTVDVLVFMAWGQQIDLDHAAVMKALEDCSSKARSAALAGEDWRHFYVAYEMFRESRG
jgi:hypothetical protein